MQFWDENDEDYCWTDKFIVHNNDMITESQLTIEELVIDPDQDNTIIDHRHGLCYPIQNVELLIFKVRHYLQHNKIRSCLFAQNVLNIASSYLSSLLNKKNAREWGKQSIKQQICFARMNYWMIYVATHGNNPLAKAKGSNKLPRIVAKKPAKKVKPRTMLGAIKNDETRSRHVNKNQKNYLNDALRKMSEAKPKKGRKSQTKSSFIDDTESDSDDNTEVLDEVFLAEEKLEIDTAIDQILPDEVDTGVSYQVYEWETLNSESWNPLIG